MDIDLDKVQENEGLEVSGIPEGIPSLPEYLADYCSASVSPAHSFVWMIIMCIIFLDYFMLWYYEEDYLILR